MLKKLLLLLITCFYTAALQAQSLPDSSRYSIISQSLVTLSREPSYRAEITTQAILGTPVKVLGKDGGWTHIETPEGYTGWTSAPLKLITAAELHAMNGRPRAVVTDNDSFIYTRPAKNSDIVTQVLMGNIFYITKPRPRRGYYAVQLPDGRNGFIQASAVSTWQNWKRSIALNGESVERVAKRFVGVPYTWGGTSARGLDCSGLTKTTYLMHGIILPRDARQQYLTGTSVADTANNFRALKKGDLLFFGRADSTGKYNIVHTAIYLQNGKFIQAASGYVQVNSLKPGDADYDAYNHNRYVTARRIMNVPVNGTWSIFSHPWYN